MAAVGENQMAIDNTMLIARSMCANAAPAVMIVPLSTTMRVMSSVTRG